MPSQPKIYHIVHVDRVSSIASEGWLQCDAEMTQRPNVGGGLGIDHIKARRRSSELQSHPGLHVGDCVPFYFCPRSIMLYMLAKGNHADLAYRGGQKPIVHLQADLQKTTAWAEAEGLRWAFTLSNAGAFGFEDRCDLAQLHEIDWRAVKAKDWRAYKHGKQAEFLLEAHFPWSLVTRVGVQTERMKQRILSVLPLDARAPEVAIQPDWYYESVYV